MPAYCNERSPDDARSGRSAGLGSLLITAAAPALPTASGVSTETVASTTSAAHVRHLDPGRGQGVDRVLATTRPALCGEDFDRRVVEHPSRLPGEGEVDLRKDTISLHGPEDGRGEGDAICRGRLDRDHLPFIAAYAEENGSNERGAGAREARELTV